MILDLPPALVDDQILATNLAALREKNSGIADLIVTPDPPPGARLVTARDAVASYCWEAPDGRLHWLGRTTMPRVRAEALVEAFSFGAGNVLLEGLGAGWEARLLLERMAPHQAVLVIEPRPWIARCALAIHDFADEIRLGRLVLFAGDDAWDQLRAFLLRETGYLTPDRVLAWPWYGVAESAAVRERMEVIAGEVARVREQRTGNRELKRTGTEAQSTEAKVRGAALNGPAIALVSTNVDSSVQRLAERLEAGAVAAGLRVLRRTMQSPDVVHPLAVQAALDDFDADACWVLGATPSELPYRLPDAAPVVFAAHDGPLEPAWLARVPPSTVLVVQTPKQHEQALGCAHPAKKTILLRPAALPALANAVRLDDRATPPRVLVVAPGPDPSPEAVGLHLASHCHLWREASELLRARVATYRDDDAGALLAAAEGRLGVRLQSDDVQRGLIDRIRWVLGPAIVGQEYARALLAANIEFDLVGLGWSFDEALARRRVAPAWPGPDRAREFLGGYRVCVALDTTPRPNPELLDALAAGLIGVPRFDLSSAFGEPSPEHRAWLSSPAPPASPKQLAERVRMVLADITTEVEKNRSLSASINAHHTWSHRVLEILAASR